MAIRTCRFHFNGWMLREHEDPSAVPVLYRGLWCLLSDDGSAEPTKPAAEEAK